MFDAVLLARAQRLIGECATRKIGITTIESCTGGLLSALLTAVSGSSAVIHSNIVTYDNSAKQHYASVSAQTLSDEGAVSEAVAQQMARGGAKALAQFQQFDKVIAIAITGVAGPTGGTPEKPVGMVCFGVAHGEDVISNTAYFSGDRHTVRMCAVEYALGLLENYSHSA
jgi:nicotinamide-nucleotide amidase